MSLKFINIDKIPNLKALNKLNTLAVSGWEINHIDENMVNWKNLTTLEISSTSVFSLDDSIITQLQNLRHLDISYSKFTDFSFINSLPMLEDINYRGYSTDDVDVECLKQHPNYKDDWLDK